MQSRPRDYQLPQLATTLEASAAYILMLRDNALDVARQAITGRNPTPKAERINIREVISKQIVPIFREYAKMKETVELSFSVEPSVPEEILTDRRWLSQMIFNYLTNAIK
jgi:signal transduction histidine kinase